MSALTRVKEILMKKVQLQLIYLVLYPTLVFDFFFCKETVSSNNIFELNSFETFFVYETKNNFSLNLTISRLSRARRREKEEDFEKCF